MADLDQAARKQEEFPGDEQANIDLEVAEATLDSITGAAEEVVEAKEVGLSETPTMQELIQRSRERRAYNSMWYEARMLFM